MGLLTYFNRYSRSVGFEYSTTSSEEKKIESSRLAFSAESAACIALGVMVSAKSPLMLPGAALAGFVAPTRFRTNATAFGPSQIMVKTGPENRQR